MRHLTGVQMTKEQVWDRVTELRRRDKQELLSWMKADGRAMSQLERVWAMYRQLPAVMREELQSDLDRLLGS
ncbi:hypothetical protein [Streptomyces anatolicus]|uniref:hypothetical protein n=1 Tax=Streptomyces anatolicus TaxID=2675858 RepID=UPI0021559B15|nr:hypothetical protein [Streptomyces anatolicus]